MLKRFYVRSIRERILIPITATLILSILGLALTIISSQQHMLENMRGSVETLLSESNSKVRADLEKVKADTQKALLDMSKKSTDRLTDASQKALDSEKENVGAELKDSLAESSESIALLLAQVAPPPILSNDFTALMSYVKAVNTNRNIVFAVFFAKDGKPLTRFLNQKNPKIKEYLKGQGKNKIQKALNGAAQDSDVFLVEKPVLLEGEPLGKVVLCINRATANRKIEEMAGRFANLVETNNKTIDTVLENESEQVTGRIDQLVVSIIETSTRDTKNTIDEITEFSNQTISRTKQVIIIGGGICVVLVFVIVVLVTIQIIRPIAKAVEVSNGIAQGDFNQNIDTDRIDEIGDLNKSMNAMIKGLQAKADVAAAIADGDLTQEVELASDRDILGRTLMEMAESLNTILSRVNGTADQVAQGAGQVSGSSQALSQGATQQAASLEEITSSMTEVGSQTKLNAENASQANQLSITARKEAEEGNIQMQDMIAAMSDITASSKEMAKIIKVIDDIAFQTNLLALNAAVEAARAGKHGKGFAVVAQEVRNLAGRSAKAAQETTLLIEGAVQKVEDGMDIVSHTAQAFSAIAEGTTKVTDLIGEVAAANNEQANGIAQVNQGLGQVDQVTQQNTANAEQTAAAADELSSQARQLRQLVSRFKLRTSVPHPTRTLPAAQIPPPGQPPSIQPPTRYPEDEWTPTPGDRIAEPEDFISLDDKDFGKY